MEQEITYNYKLIRKILNNNASKMHSLDFIFAELAKRVMSRMDYIKIQPEIIVDCGSGNGHDYLLLKEKFAKAKIIEIDSSIKALSMHHSSRSLFNKLLGKSSARHLINADAYSLPLKNQSVDFVYANQLLPYLSDLISFFKETRRVLKVGGSFCIAGLGVDSFKELREMGLSTYRFPDMHDIGDMLIEVGFNNPVVDTEYITLDYDDVQTLINDIKLIGCGAANSALMRTKVDRQMVKDLKTLFNSTHRLTLEIFVAHGWKDQQKIDLPIGHSPITFTRK